MALTATSKASSRPGPFTIGGVGLVLISTVASVASVERLGATVRIRWTIGSFQQYGPEHAPTVFVLALFPALVSVLFVGAWLLRTRLERTDGLDGTRGSDEFGEFRLAYDLCTVVGLGALVAIQFLVIGLNL